MKTYTVAPNVPTQQLSKMTDALLDAAIAEIPTGYVIIAVNGQWDYSVSFNIDRPTLKHLLEIAAKEVPETDDATPQN